MAVQAIPVTPPPQPEPRFIDALTNFISNYWAVLALIVVGFVLIIVIYVWRSEKKKKEKTVYHKIWDNIHDLCKMQANRARLQGNPMIMFAIAGISAVITWVTSMIFLSYAGIFIGLLLGFTEFLVAGIIYAMFSPFMKRDMVFVRYVDSGKVFEKYVGDYAGEHYGSDSYLNLLVYKGRKNVFWKNKYIIRIPQSTSAFYDLEKLRKDFVDNEEGYKKAMKEIEDKYSSFISEIVQFNERTIVINNAKSLDKFRFMYYPVFVDEMNHVINRGVRYYKSLKEQVALEQLYDLTDESSKAQIKAIQINPRVQYKQATGDEVIDDVEIDNKE